MTIAQLQKVSHPCIRNLQNTLNHIYNWAIEIKIKLILSKCKELIVDFSNNKQFFSTPGHWRCFSQKDKICSRAGTYNTERYIPPYSTSIVPYSSFLQSPLFFFAAHLLFSTSVAYSSSLPSPLLLCSSVLLSSVLLCSHFFHSFTVVSSTSLQSPVLLCSCLFHCGYLLFFFTVISTFQSPPILLSNYPPPYFFTVTLSTPLQ